MSDNYSNARAGRFPLDALFRQAPKAEPQAESVVWLVQRATATGTGQRATVKWELVDEDSTTPLAA